jgi:hypothetical protein
MALPQLNLTVVTRDCVVGGVIPDYLQPLVDLRQGKTGVNIPTTELGGRIRINNNLFVNALTYEDLAMRRKAEVLQYNGNNTNDSQKRLFSKMQFRKRMRNVDTTNTCPTIIYPPSNSGVTDMMFSGYYLNKNVPYYPSI